MNHTTLKALALTLLLIGCSQNEIKTNHPLVGQTLPQLNIEDLSGNAVTIKPDSRGTVINIWATWCPPCVKELPGIEELAVGGKYQVITIAADRTSEPVSQFLIKQKLPNLPTLWDKNGQEVRSKLQISTYPQTFILDKNNVIRGVESGEWEWNTPEMWEKIDNYRDF